VAVKNLLILLFEADLIDSYVFFKLVSIAIHQSNVSKPTESKFVLPVFYIEAG